MKPTALFTALSILVVLILVAGCTSTPAAQSGALVSPAGSHATLAGSGVPPGASDGNASLYRAGNVSVLRLEGSYREMGRQYGRLMAQNISKMYDTVVAQIGRPGFIIGITSESQLVNYSMAQYAYYPQQYREIVEGISETSSVPVGHILVIDQLIPNFANFFRTDMTQDEIVAFLRAQGDGTPANSSDAAHHCSSVIAWGAYTGGGPLVVGRNFDFGAAYRSFDPYLSMIVYNPTDGTVPTAVIGWPGSVGGIEAFNRAGLMMETDDNSHITEPNAEVHHDRTPLNLLVLDLVKDSATLSQFDAAMNATRFGYPLLANVATPSGGYTYEIGTRDVVRRGDTNPGLQVVANFPISPFWNEPSNLSDVETGYSLSRRANLMALGEQNRGTINTTVMEKIFDTPYSRGGATFGADSPEGSATIYQFVYVPETRTLTLKAPQYSDWTTVELAPLFRA
ncbi:MAG: C45 family peptidase [Methanospirillum sp.]